MRKLPTPLCGGILAFASLAAHGQGPSDFQHRPAVFRVTSEVVNDDVGPFSLSVGGFGNTLNRTGKGSFEPATFRTRLEAQADSPDRVVDDRRGGIAYYDSYASGYLDGADVRVYRVVDGRMALVREDRVAAGGTVVEYWDRDDNQVIPAGTTEARFKWADWSRPGSHRWFTVFAVDESGNVSEEAAPVRLERSVAKNGVEPGNHERRFRPVRGGDDRTPPAAPGDFRAVVNANGLVEMTWAEVPADDVAGYRIATTDTDPASHRGVYLQLENPATDDARPIRRGDLVIVSKPLAGFRRSWLSNRIAGLDREVRQYIPDGVPKGFDPEATPGKTWRLVRHGGDTPVTDPGEYFLEMTLREGDAEKVGKSGIPDLADTRQDFYPVPKDGAEYVMEVWLKADRGGAPPVVFTWDGDERIGGFVGEHELRPTTHWKKHTVRFTGRSSDEGHHAYLVLEATGPATYGFDNFRIYRADAPYLDYLPEQYANLRETGSDLLRTHAPIKTGRTTYSMRQYLGAPGQAEGVPKGNTLPQALRVIEQAGVDPWLQVEYHMSPEEWLAFAEYMAAPYDPGIDSPTEKPYAYLRHAQGRHRPWVDAFDRIYFELSNETWNGLFKPWTFDAMTDAATGRRVPRGTAYGMFHDHVAGVLRSSPYWSGAVEEKFVHVLGGWIIGSYNREALAGSESADFITIAAYNGGWDEGEGPPRTTPASYFNVLSQVNQTAIPRARDLAELAERERRSGREIAVGTYEAGPGYALNGLNNARVTPEQAREQERVMKSKLAGTATLDSFLARAALGFDVDNFFTFAEGDLWKSHAYRRRGGQPHACFLPLQLFNHEAAGDMLRVETLSTPTVDLPAVKRRESIDDAPLAAAYATRRGDRFHVWCLSRRYPGYPEGGGDGYTPFTLELPFARASSITLHRLTGEITDTNIREEKVTVETVSIHPAALAPDGRFRVGPATGGDRRGLPPAEAFLYVFEGVQAAE